MTVALRPYGMPDRTDLIRVINQVCGEGCWMGTTRFIPTSTWQHVLLRPQCNRHLLLLAVDGDAVVGWCRMFPASSAWLREVDLGIGLLAAYRDGGIGAALMQQALAWAWSADLQRVTLRTRLDNQRAMRVFIRCGFEFLQETDAVWADMACLRPVLRPPQLVSPEHDTASIQQRQAVI